MSRIPQLLTERISGPHYQHNAQTLAFTRTATSVLAGGVAGVLGLTGLYGFLFYLLSILVSAALWMHRINYDAKPYFSHWYHLAADGLMSGLMTYILFWTLIYDVVYIY